MAALDGPCVLDSVPEPSCTRYNNYEEIFNLGDSQSSSLDSLGRKSWNLPTSWALRSIGNLYASGQCFELRESRLRSLRFFDSASPQFYQWTTSHRSHVLRTQGLWPVGSVHLRQEEKGVQAPSLLARNEWDGVQGKGGDRDRFEGLEALKEKW